MGFESLEKGVQLLHEGPWANGAIPELLVSTASGVSNTSSYTPSPSFEDAKKSFIRSEAYFSALLLSTTQELAVDGKWLLQHVKWLIEIMDFPRKWAISVYEDTDAAGSDHELAYQMYDSFTLAVNRLRVVLDKAKNGELRIKWKDERIPDPWPIVPVPKPLNRKI
jgi:hypothetical protein